MGLLNEKMAVGDNVTIAVKLEDLVEFHREVLSDVKRRLETQISENSQERYLTIKQVCSFLSVDASTLWRWRKRGYLNSVVIGGKRLYRASDVRRMIDAAN